MPQPNAGPHACDPLPDAEAVARTLAGQSAAFEAIVLRYERAIYIHLLRMVGRPEDAEDLTQETFLRALRGLGSYRRGEPLRPWLYRIATNTAISALRRRGPVTVSLDEPESPALELPDPRPDSPAERAGREQVLSRLERAVSELPAESAAIFNLHYRVGLTLEEIGAATGRKPGTVAVALHRLRLRLREMIFR